MDLTPKKVMKRGKPVWMIDLRSEGRGRRYFPTRAAAHEESVKLEAEANAHRLSAVNISAEDAARFFAAQQRLGDSTIEQAVDYFLAHYRPVEPVTVAEAVAACMDARRAAGYRRRSLDQLGYTLASFSAAYGSRQLSTITRDDVETWLANPAWKSPATRKGRLTDVRTLFNFAIGWKWIKVSPAAKIVKIKLDDKEPGILTVEQCRALMTAAQTHAPRMLPYFTLGLFCGLRPAEIMRLTWAEVRRGQGHVEVTAVKSKTRQRRLVTISPNCEAWLALGGDLPPVNWQDNFDRVRKAAGISNWPHDAMRHSFVSYSIPIHGIARTAQEAGHSEAMLIQHYRALTTREQAEAFWSIMPQPASNP